MGANVQEPIMEDLGTVQEREQMFRGRLALQFKGMDEELKNPNLTPDQRYAIAAPLLFWME